MKVTSYSAIFFTLFCALISGCDVQTYEDAADEFNSGTSGTPPPPPSSDPPTSNPPPAFAATLSEIQTNVFTPSCASASCHGASAAADLNLESGNSHAMLVGIASSQEPGILRVAPNDPGNSYLIQKMEGTAATGARMPTGTPLAQSEIDIIRQWIIDGALDDSAASSGAIQVKALFPAPGSVISGAPAAIVAGFDRDLDASTINASTFVLLASGGDQVFGNGNDLQIAADAVRLTGPRTAVFDLSNVPLTADTYRVELRGSGPSVIMDLDANALLGGAFGSPGDFTAEFIVSAD